MQPLRWSFQPGPSQPYPFLRDLLTQAFDENVLSLLHRGPAFHAHYQRVHKGLADKLGMPQDYSVLFFSSATEIWQVLAACTELGSERWHFVSDETGFGERWQTRTLGHNAVVKTIAENQTVGLSLFCQTGEQTPDILSFCSNETSNGQQVPWHFIRSVRAHYPEALLAVDATSHLAIDELPISETDLLYASVQKGFGCPAGLAILLVSPRAAQRIVLQAFHPETSPYNTLSGVLTLARSWETTYTPNILGIYLLGQVLDCIPPLHAELPRLHAQAQAYYAWADAHPVCSALQSNADWRSRTSICIQCPADVLPRLHYQARQEGLELGKGYGQHRNTTFRIANFPALPPQAHQELLRFLQHQFDWQL